MSQELRFKNIDQKSNYFSEQKEPNELMSRKHKSVCTTEHILILASTITGCISISIFVSLLGISIIFP